MVRSVVYDVAVSIDGFINAGDSDVKVFAGGGPHVTDYFERLKHYDTVIMGRRTYEAGYAWGLKPGDKPYPHMRHHVFSRTLQLPEDSDIEVIDIEAADCVRAMKGGIGEDIYLCGGGAFAGAMLQAGLIDRLVLKMNPIALGRGTPLFGGVKVSPARFRLASSKPYENGVILLEYAID